MIFAVIVIPPASAQPAEQLAGLFMQACLPYAGAAARQRAWAAENKLPELPEPARSVFLRGAPGKVFDATNASGKYVVLSSDDGICATIGNQARGLEVTAALEADLRRAGIEFRLAIERDDKTVTALHHREYLATRNGRIWRILAATVNHPNGGQAMLTAAPE
jgi:hypothetical protein